MRISELAAELGVTSKTVIAELERLKITGKTASSGIDPKTITAIKKKLSGKAASSTAKKKKAAKKKTAAKKTAKAKKSPKEAVKTKTVKAKEEKPVKKAVATKPQAVDETKSKEEEEAKQRAEEAARIKAKKEEKQKAEEEARIKEEEQKLKEKKDKEEEEELKKLLDEEDRLKKEEEARQIVIDEAITVKELAEKLNITVGEIIKKLFIQGTAVTVNQTLGVELSTELAKEVGFIVKVEKEKKEKEEKKEEKKRADLSHLPVRPPVVTIMGHVDHGKTSLLDAIRKTNVAAKEAGGITQHIGAYNIDLSKGSITFLDTPGHEAFTAIRARGASVTDIVVLVVAADDGVMPQTEEAINHAKAAGVTIMVAINKIDVPNAQPDKVRQELSKFGLLSEDWGGDTIFCEVSAKEKLGIDHLLEMIHLQAEILELHADPDKLAESVVIESKLEKNRGPVLSVLVKNGTLRTGDPFIAGAHNGKIRAMTNDKGQNIKQAGPSMPVEILGAADICEPGELLTVMESDKKARQISNEKKGQLREKKFADKHHVRLENVVESLAEGEVKGLNLVVKGDTQGSVDAVRQLLSKLEFSQVRMQVIHSGVGGITETDVMLADASEAIIIGFNVRPTPKAKQLAEQTKIDVRLYNVIYEITDHIKAAALGLLEPTLEEKTVGRAEIRNMFKITKMGTIAGCKVQEGMVRRGSKCRLIRDSVVVYTGSVSSLRRFKDDVKEVQNGYECGIGLENFNDIKVGDIIELYVEEEVAPVLSP